MWRIVVEDMAELGRYGEVSIAFEVSSVMDVASHATGWTLAEQPVESYSKDYDETEDPTRWAQQFDVAQWRILSAFQGERRIGGAVLAFDTPGVHLLAGRRDLTLLWDIRVEPESRGLGVGRALFVAAEGWARAQGCRILQIETQNTNVGACRFYERMGCRIVEANAGQYRRFPDEIQLIWHRHLAP